MHWQTSRRKLDLDRPLVMGILNVTPDSFSDGGKYPSPDEAIRRAEAMIAEGADMIDVGGESTRPGGERVTADEEVWRTAPVIEALAKAFDAPISIDTSKQAVASAAIDAGAEIINDISGLRWDEAIAELAADTGAGLVIMHSRGNFDEMHKLPPADDIIADVISDLRRGISVATGHGVSDEQIALDVGIGFGKTVKQNLELLAKLDKLAREFETFPLLVGASRKSFLGKILDEPDATRRLGGSIAAALISAERGAHILRVHDVAETADALKLLGEVTSI